MKTFTPIALCIFYVTVVIGLSPLLGSVASSWFITCLSLLFVWVYQWFVRGRLAVPLVIIFFITVVLPVAVLFAIGMQVYHSWPNTAGSIFAAFHDHGQFWGLELFAPLFTAAIGALVFRRRSNIAFERDARKNGARPST